MSERPERLPNFRRAEQDNRVYSTCSRWYTTLSNTIEYLALCETGTTTKERLVEAWPGIYNLFMLYGEWGDEEFKRFPAWVGGVLHVPTVRRYFTRSPARGLPLAEFRQKTSKAAVALLERQRGPELALWRNKRAVPDKGCRAGRLRSRRAIHLSCFPVGPRVARRHVCRLAQRAGAGPKPFVP